MITTTLLHLSKDFFHSLPGNLFVKKLVLYSLEHRGPLSNLVAFKFFFQLDIETVDKGTISSMIFLKVIKRVLQSLVHSHVKSLAVFTVCLEFLQLYQIARDLIKGLHGQGAQLSGELF